MSNGQASPRPQVNTAQVNPAGEIVLECDTDKGEIYVRPVGKTTKPVNLFVSSQHATYTLLLRRSDTPADTIVIRDKAPRQARADQGNANAVRPPGPARSLAQGDAALRWPPTACRPTSASRK